MLAPHLAQREAPLAVKKTAFAGQVDATPAPTQEAAPTEPATDASPAPHATHTGGLTLVSMYEFAAHAQLSIPICEYAC